VASFNELTAARISYFAGAAPLLLEEDIAFRAADAAIDEAELALTKIGTPPWSYRGLPWDPGYVLELLHGELWERGHVSLRPDSRQQMVGTIVSIAEGWLDGLAMKAIDADRTAILDLKEKIDTAWQRTKAWRLAEARVHAVRGPVVVTASTVAIFIIIVLHYLLLVELPFWWGQRRWKAMELHRSEATLRTAEKGLDARFATETPGTVAESTLRQWMDYMVAREKARDAKEIPLHTFKSAADLVKKATQAGLVALATTALGPAGPDLVKALMP
jgi:hypothetical protein